MRVARVGLREPFRTGQADWSTAGSRSVLAAPVTPTADPRARRGAARGRTGSATGRHRGSSPRRARCEIRFPRLWISHQPSPPPPLGGGDFFYPERNERMDAQIGPAHKPTQEELDDIFRNNDKEQK